jgi:hypothetical protein
MLKRSSSMPRILAFLVVLFLLVMTLPATQAVQAEDNHVAVFGTMIVRNTATNCNSPLGTCFIGTVAGNMLNGTVTGQANTIKEIDNKKGNPIAFVLTGVFTITTQHGTLTGNAEFYQNYPALTGHGTLTITGGTKRYKHTTGTIHLEEPKPPVPPVPDGVQTFYLRGLLSRDADNNDN